MKIILDLCSGSGAWSKPYLEAGYHVRYVDLDLAGDDIRFQRKYNLEVQGILCAPPCDTFAVSGARWWKVKGTLALRNALSIVDACLRAVVIYKPKFWCLENPVGRLVHYLGKPKMYFHPWEYGDPYTKKTALWGEFNTPIKTPVEPTNKDYIHHLPPTPQRKALRSITPSGFAKAFFEANP